MALHFRVRYRSRGRWRSASSILSAGSLALPLTAVLFWTLLDSRQRGSLAESVAAALGVLASWAIVGFFAKAWVIRRRLIQTGEAALTASPTELKFLDWRGRTRALRWSEIDSFHILRTHGANMLFVEGRYEDAAAQPVTFVVDDLDIDPQDLLTELERIRISTGGAH